MDVLIDTRKMGLKSFTLQQSPTTTPDNLFLIRSTACQIQCLKLKKLLDCPDSIKLKDFVEVITQNFVALVIF
jgi:hypothetical protein